MLARKKMYQDRLKWIFTPDLQQTRHRNQGTLCYAYAVELKLRSLSRTYHKTLAKVGPQTISIVEPTPKACTSAFSYPDTFLKVGCLLALFSSTTQQALGDTRLPSQASMGRGEKEQDFQRMFSPMLNYISAKVFQLGYTPCRLLFSKYSLYSLASACCSLQGLYPAFLHLANSHSFQQLKPKPYLLWEAFSDFPSGGILCSK